MAKLTVSRKIQLSLGFLWLLDGLLQLQPKMFGPDFVNNVINPAAGGQPLIVAGPIHFAAKIVMTHPAVFNTFFAGIQLLIGLLILNRKTVRIGLIVSVFWGLNVWVMGEAFGGLLGGNGSLIMGFPGAALIYVLLALAVMPGTQNGHIVQDNKPAFWLPLAWVIIWVSGGILQLLPGPNYQPAMTAMIASNATTAPAWMTRVDLSISNYLLRANHWFIPLLIAIEVLIGLGILLPGKIMKTAVIAGSGLSLAFWFYGQSFGGYYTGVMTDPNTGPLLVLLGISALSCQKLPIKELAHASWLKIEAFVT